MKILHTLVGIGSAALAAAAALPRYGHANFPHGTMKYSNIHLADAAVGTQLLSVTKRVEKTGISSRHGHPG